MRKLSVLFVCLLLLSACATTQDSGVTARLDKLERQVSRLQMSGAQATGASFRPFRGLTGNTAGTLDYLDGASVAVGDVAFVSLNAVSGYGDAILVYNYRDFGASVSESIPYIIKPDTNPNANYAWSLELSSLAYPKITAGNLDLDTAVTSGGVAIVRAGFIQINAAGTVKLPSAASVGYGTTICVWVDDSNETCTIDINASDVINLKGTPLTAGNAIDNATSADAGDFICLVSTTDTGDGSTDGWISLGYNGTWADSGAD